MLEGMISAREAARRAQVSHWTIRRWVKRGWLVADKDQVTDRIYFKPEDVEPLRPENRLVRMEADRSP